MARLVWLSLLGALFGCAPSRADTSREQPFQASSSTYLRHREVPGPHGEYLLEIQCLGLTDCMVLSRELCHGNFDVIATGVADVNITEMLIFCHWPALPDGGT